MMRVTGVMAPLRHPCLVSDAVAVASESGLCYGPTMTGFKLSYTGTQLELQGDGEPALQQLYPTCTSRPGRPCILAPLSPSIRIDSAGSTGGCCCSARGRCSSRAKTTYRCSHLLFGFVIFSSFFQTIRHSQLPNNGILKNNSYNISIQTKCRVASLIW